MTARPVALIYRALKLGDFLTGVPAYRAIARAFPNHRKMLAAPATFVPLMRLAQSFDGLIDTVPESLQSLPPLGNIDVAIDLHGRGPECHRVVLETHPRRLIAFYNSAIPESINSPQWYPEEHEVYRWCRMLEGHGIAADPTDIRLKHPPKIAAWSDAVILHPGAASRARRWPVDRWARIARALTQRGERVLISGTGNEFEIARSVAEYAGLPVTHVLAGRTSLATLSAIIAHARQVISGDTGVAHLAFAFGTPSVTLFGPVSPAHWGPPHNPKHRIIWHGRSGNPHGEMLDPGLEKISVHEVLEALH